MAKKLIYSALIIFAIVACEEVYRPDLDVVDDLLVVEAILISNQIQNQIHLYNSINYNYETKSYSEISGASVYLVDGNNNKIKFEEKAPGIYQLNFEFDTEGLYYLYIQYNGEEYRSEIQTVPEIPLFDSIYLNYTTIITTQGASNSIDKIIEEDGIQMYVDIDNAGNLRHYRFSARKVIQYIEFYDTVIIRLSPFPITLPIYYWKSYYPTGIFNIAGPPEYTEVKKITKHPLEFFEKDYLKFIPDTVSPRGYIYYIYQYGLNEDTYNFYSNMNSQLDAEGKIFDPVYTQAEGNISCNSNPEKVALGNFEISSFAEKRYYLLYYRNRDTINMFRNIPYFYDIPETGKNKQVDPEIQVEPDFWESRNKEYPDE